MAAIDFPQILKECISLAKHEVGKNWSKLKPFAEHEFTQFAENAEFLAQLRLKNIIDDEEFKVRLRFQQTALNNVLLAIKGIGLKTAENVVNGVLGIVSTALKSAINIVLPVL
jgi:hypothetical protein